MTRINNRIGLWLVIPPLLLGLGCADDGGAGSDAGDSGMFANLEPDAEYPEPFSFLAGVRELPDGRILAADPLSQVLLRVDMDNGTADTLGGVGGGPEEYQQPDRVFPLPGDSSLLVDLGKTYLTVVGPEGTFHDGMSMALPTEDGSPSIIMPQTVDGLGRLYHTTMGRFGQGPADSSSIARYDRATNTSETMVSIWRTEPVMTRSGGNVSMSLPRMAPNDDWAVGSDGRMAVIRANGYIVEWHMPDGEVVVGPETPFEPLPIEYADKEANLNQSSSAGLSISIMRTNTGETNMQMSRGGSRGGGGDPPSVEDQTWGETFPPFQTGRSVVSPSNELWVRRWLPLDHTPVMDVFGEDGVRMGSVEIPAGAQLLGFGEGAAGEEIAYFLRTDEVDLQWLSRYRVVRN